ncbi:TPA: cell envelope integrity protein TolA [Salmonella enterica subsp. enterica serovar Newport]
MKKLIIASALLAISGSAMASNASFYKCSGSYLRIEGNIIEDHNSVDEWSTYVMDGIVKNGDVTGADLFVNGQKIGGVVYGPDSAILTTNGGFNYRCRFAGTEQGFKNAAKKAHDEQEKRQQEEAKAAKERADAEAKEQARIAAELNAKYAKNTALNQKVMAGEAKDYTISPVVLNWQHGTENASVKYTCDLITIGQLSSNSEGPVAFEKNGLIIEDFGSNNIKLTFRQPGEIAKTVQSGMHNVSGWGFYYRDGVSVIANGSGNSDYRFIMSDCTPAF